MRGPLADYYAVLGVTQEVGIGELRRAYRLLALQFHPDRAGAAGTARFQQISEAYAVLADATSRAAYDAIFDTARVRRQATGSSARARRGPIGRPAVRTASSRGCTRGRAGASAGGASGRVRRSWPTGCWNACAGRWRI